MEQIHNYMFAVFAQNKFRCLHITGIFLVLMLLVSCEDTSRKLTVLQKNTGLEWTRCSVHETNGVNTEIDTTDNCTSSHWAGQWQDALNACEILDYADHDDWRLPNIRELQSLVIYNRFLPAIDVTQFPGTHMSHYWSSTSYGRDIDMNKYAYVVDFMFGNVHFDPKDSSAQSGETQNNYRPYYVRCVRGPEKQ